MPLNTKLAITPGFLVFAAAMLVLLPLPWVAGWLIAVTVHELSHYVALVLCKVPVYHITVDVHGAKMITPELTCGQTVLCALAGPLGGLLLLFAVPVIPRVALCAFLQSVFNLLPVYPFDGGRALCAILRLFLSESAAMKICHGVHMCCLLTALLACTAAVFYCELGLFPIAFGSILWLRMKKAKIPCK